MKWFYDSEGIKLEEMDQIKNLVLGFYQNGLVGKLSSNSWYKILEVQMQLLQQEVTNDEIKDVLFFIYKNKVLGPDGYKLVWCSLF